MQVRILPPLPPLLAVVLAFLAVRLLYPVLFLPPREFWDSEELVRGVVAYDLIHGLKLPFWEYLADYYAGGSVVVGLLAAPAFLLLGPSLFALRLVALAFALGVLLVWYALLGRHFGTRAAIFTSLFLVLRPAFYLQVSSSAMGFHTESMLFANQRFLGLDFLRSGLGYDYVRGLPETGARIVRTALWYLPTVLVSDPYSLDPSLASPATYALLFGGALLYLVLRDHRRTSVLAPPPARMFVVTASVVYVVAVGATRYPLTPYGNTYLLPMLPFLFGAGGLTASDLWERAGWRRVSAGAVLAVGALAGGVGLAHVVDRRWPGAGFVMPGYSRAQLAPTILTSTGCCGVSSRR